MRAQAFKFREFFHRLQRLFQRGTVVFDNARAPLKQVHRLTGERRACAAGRQRVAWSGDVIAQNRRRK